MICDGCGCFFCDDHVKDHEVFSRDVKKYCTRTCRNTAKRERAAARKERGEAPKRGLVKARKRREPVPPCPTGNVRYQTEQAAVQAGGTWQNHTYGGERGDAPHKGAALTLPRMPGLAL